MPLRLRSGQAPLRDWEGTGFVLDSPVGAKVKVMGRNDTKPYGSRGGCFAVHDLVCRTEIHLRWPRAFFWRASGESLFDGAGWGEPELDKPELD